MVKANLKSLSERNRAGYLTFMFKIVKRLLNSQTVTYVKFSSGYATWCQHLFTLAPFKYWNSIFNYSFVRWTASQCRTKWMREISGPFELWSAFLMCASFSFFFLLMCVAFLFLAKGGILFIYIYFFMTGSNYIFIMCFFCLYHSATTPIVGVSSISTKLTNIASWWMINCWGRLKWTWVKPKCIII